MSDQPKPTFVPDTDSFVPEADQRELAKPTGEWTAMTVMDMIAKDSNAEWNVAAHNAAVAEATDAAVQEMLLVKQQLAAERDNHKRQIELIGEGCIKADAETQQLRDQLAAEREKHNKELRDYESALSDTHLSRIKVLEQQLAAERKKVADVERRLEQRRDECQILQDSNTRLLARLEDALLASENFKSELNKNE